MRSSGNSEEIAATRAGIHATPTDTKCEMSRDPVRPCRRSAARPCSCPASRSSRSARTESCGKCRHGDASPAPLQQGQPRLPLQRLHLLARGRSADAQIVCGRTDRLFGDDGEKSAQAAYVGVEAGHPTTVKQCLTVRAKSLLVHVSVCRNDGPGPHSHPEGGAAMPKPTILTCALTGASDTA